MPDLVDLRSDTVTRPTAEMRRAMAEAEVGDDGSGEDPTVNRLQEEFAARVGKEAALFVPSGVMGNQLALRLLGVPGTLVVAGRRSHVVVHESGAAGVNTSVQLRPVDDDEGTFDPDEIASIVAAAAHHQPAVSLICIENTYMPASGAPWPVERLRAVARAGGGAPVHLDGARLFNAEVATGVTAGELSEAATTVMCCLSKGLGAPVGSVLAGPAELMAAARVERHRLGGGMRQVGVVAAAGLVALRTMVPRLAEDHRRARRLAEAVANRWPDSGCDPERVHTNIVTFGHRSTEELLQHLRAEGVLAGTIAPRVARLVTHHDVHDVGIERAMKAIASAP